MHRVRPRLSCPDSRSSTISLGEPERRLELWPASIAPALSAELAALFSHRARTASSNSLGRGLRLAARIYFPHQGLSLHALIARG